MGDFVEILKICFRDIFVIWSENRTQSDRQERHQRGGFENPKEFVYFTMSGGSFVSSRSVKFPIGERVCTILEHQTLERRLRILKERIKVIEAQNEKLKLLVSDTKGKSLEGLIPPGPKFLS